MKRTWLFAAFAALLSFLPLAAQSRPDATTLGALPVLHNGRVKPLDTIGRSTLLMLRGKQSVYTEGKSIGSSEWILDMLFNPEAADRYPVFMINDADVLAMLGKRPDEQRFFSFKDLEPKLQEIEQQEEKAGKLESAQRDRFQRAIFTLGNNIHAYQRLKNTAQVEDTRDMPMELAAFGQALAVASEEFRKQQANQPFDKAALDRIQSFGQRYTFLAQTAPFAMLVPPKGGDDHGWTTMGQGLLDAPRTGQPHPGIGLYAQASSAWKRGDKAAFDTAVAGLKALAEERIPEQLSKTRLERVFNAVQPFYISIWLYIIAALMYFVSWLNWEKPLKQGAWWIMLGSLVLHTFGLFTRMYLEGRPPVTNLYSSAVFIGWFAVLLAVPFERYSKRGFAASGGAVVGASTLVIAQSLMDSGDTMEMMRAVLDSNFWLATHVTTITIGYSATFLAGLLAIMWIVRGIFSRSFSGEESQVLVKSTYGVICFALFFSFVGTVLGGIWADQSWGRFWGWDPKENGALLIVLWNALILHARWAGYVRERGLMVMAVFGNIITSLSWFGVNMLGIGLHSYGFTDKTFSALASFVLSQLIIMIVAGFTPPHLWRSGLIKPAKQ